jgi:hypothetical protein
LAANEIRFRPSALRRPNRDCWARAGGFFAAFATRAPTVSLARTTDDLAESSKSRNPRALSGNCSMTLDSNDSTLFNRFKAFLAFMDSPQDRLWYHSTSACKAAREKKE